jgi:hypothetical protein
MAARQAPAHAATGARGRSPDLVTPCRTGFKKRLMLRRHRITSRARRFPNALDRLQPRQGNRRAGDPVLAYRNFSVASPTIARISDTIQNRITICGSAQPFFSKWWWIGAIRKTRFLVRL